MLLDISSACSLYMLHGIVTISSEEAWYNFLGCFLSYFTNLSKVHSLLFQILVFRLLQVFIPNFFIIFTFSMLYHTWKTKQLFMVETPQIFSWINRNKISRRSERYKHGVKFTITFVENSSHIVAIPNFVLPLSNMKINFRRNSLGITLNFETFLSCYEINNLFKLRIFTNFGPRTLK
jgi:hypothetical protein